MKEVAESLGVAAMWGGLYYSGVLPDCWGWAIFATILVLG